MDRHGDVGDHFVVDEFVSFRQHHVAVQGQDAAEFRRFKNVDVLIITLLGVQVLADPDAELHIRRMKFTEPHFHAIAAFHANTLIRFSSASSGPVMLQPFSFAYRICSRISAVIRSPGARMGIPGG